MVAVDIRHTELDDEMKAAAVEAATHASENFTTEKEMAAYIKSQFDKKFKPVWHCVAGRDFGRQCSTKDFQCQSDHSQITVGDPVKQASK
ncbi:dynein light chain LC8-type [Paragonimus westermani]|uniref:Dynein light chain n=1 Tax=Paragonimus westermani TaxID=34504 RepID=A0A5J4NLI4_9TREM|nr:dynein light chain LC8-type [Paragonimus westermani]